MKKINSFNRVEIKGYVSNFVVKEFEKCTMGELSFKDTVTGNVTRGVMFGRKGMKFDDLSFDSLHELQKVFLDEEGVSKKIQVVAHGRVSESTGKNSSGANVSYTNINLYKLASNDDGMQHATLRCTGIVDAKSVKELDDGTMVCKVRVGMMTTNKDEEITGVDMVTLVGYGEIAEKLDEVEKGSNGTFYADFLNVAGETDRFGTVSGYIRENRIAKLGKFTEEDDLDEKDVANYRKAKKLKKGEVIKTKKVEEVEEEDFDDMEDWG